MNFDTIRLAAAIRLPTVPKVVLMILAARANKAEQCWPSVPMLCDDTGLCNRAVRNGIDALVKAGLVSKVVKGRFGVIYTLHVTVKAAPGVEYDSAEEAANPAPGADYDAGTPALNSAPGAFNSAPGAGKSAPGATNLLQEQTQELSKLPPVATRVRREARGSRLPENWQPDEACRAYAIERNLDPDKLAEDFRGYWHSPDAKSPMRKDWPGTWQRRCRDVAGRSSFTLRSPNLPNRSNQGSFASSRRPATNGALEMLIQAREEADHNSPHRPGQGVIIDG